MLPGGSLEAEELPFQANGWHYTTSCNTQSSVPEDGQNDCPKHVELTGIINKPLLLHLVGCLYYLFLVVGTVSKYATLPTFQRNKLFPSSWKVLKKISALLVSL